MTLRTEGAQLSVRSKDQSDQQSGFEVVLSVAIMALAFSESAIVRLFHCFVALITDDSHARQLAEFAESADSS